MESGKEKELRIAQLSFIGKILSVFTHELNNHLAILKESTGLTEDILRSQKSFVQHELEGCLKTLQSIENQIQKTSWLSKKLNNFGHRMDNPLSSFNVNEVIDELLTLLNRLAAQKLIVFEKNLDVNIPAIYNDPSKLQFLFFCLIEKGLKNLDKNGKIIFKTTSSRGSVSINIARKGNLITADENEICTDDIFRYLANELEGDFSTGEGDNEVIITLPVSAGNKLSG